jgi:hypothetical protein
MGRTFAKVKASAKLAQEKDKPFFKDDNVSLTTLTEKKKIVGFEVCYKNGKPNKFMVGTGGHSTILKAFQAAEKFLQSQK